MAEGFVFFAAVLAQGFLCAKLLPRKYNDMEKGILVGAAEIAEIAVAANLLAVFGIFSLYALSAILFVSAGICLWIFCKREKVQEASGKMSRWDVAAVALLLISFCLCFFFPTKYMPAGRDPGVYLINGVHIAKTGGITYESNVYLNEHYEEVKDLLKLDAPGFYSEYEYGISKEPGSVVTQFLHMFPSLLAVGYRVGGLEGLVRVNAFINFFALGIMYLLTKRMFGEKAAGLALLFLTVNPAQLWAGRITQTELLSQMLLFLGIYWFYEGWETEKLRYAGYAGLLFGISTFNRIDAYIIGVGILVMWGYCEWFEVKKKYARVAAGLYLILGAAALGYGFIFSYPYYKVHLHKGLAMIVGINVVLAVLVLLVGAILCMKRKSMQRNAVQTGQESDSPEKIREFVQGRGSDTVIRIAWSSGIICLSPASGIVKKLRRAGQPLCHAAVLLVCDDPGNDITVLRFLPDITQKSGVGKISALFSDRIQQSDRLYRQTIHQSGSYLDVKKMDLCLYPVCTDDGSLWDQPVTVEWEEPQGEICGTGRTCHFLSQECF